MVSLDMSASRLLKLLIVNLSLILAFQANAFSNCDKDLLVGRSQSDITGPTGDIGMNGYGELTQRAQGLHMRLKARAFVFDSPCDEKLLAMVIADLAMVHVNVKDAIISKLDKTLPGVFTHDNLMLSATHTHAAHGGYGDHTLYNITTIGRNQKGFTSVVDGSVEAIIKAYKNRQQAQLSFAQGELEGVSWNRSPKAYNRNLEVHTKRYDSLVDQRFRQIFIQSSQTDKALGLLNWFAIHPVSLSLSNRLISGDNKGLAAFETEAYMSNSEKSDDSFVAGFFQSNSGDVSPYPVAKLDVQEDQWQRLESSARAQSKKAIELTNLEQSQIFPSVDYRHIWVDMHKVAAELELPSHLRSCYASLGVAFAAGTENGQPLKLFSEGTVYGQNWPEITLMPEDQACQSEKVILLPVGRLGWIAHVLPFQLFKIGQVAILGAPFEITTMAGRLLMEAVAEKLAPLGVDQVLITALANEYSHYVTTPEEYQAQHYEGGSTLFGPDTFRIYKYIYSYLADTLVNDKDTVTAGPRMKAKRQAYPVPDAIVDAIKERTLNTKAKARDLGDWFGQKPSKLAELKQVYQIGERVIVDLDALNPNLYNHRNASVISLQKFNTSSSAWTEYKNDNDPSVVFRWNSNGPFSKGRLEVSWLTSIEDQLASYRICFHTKAVSFKEEKRPLGFDRCSRSFSVN